MWGSFPASSSHCHLAAPAAPRTFSPAAVWQLRSCPGPRPDGSCGVGLSPGLYAGRWHTSTWLTSYPPAGSLASVMPQDTWDAACQCWAQVPVWRALGWTAPFTSAGEANAGTGFSNASCCSLGNWDARSTEQPNLGSSYFQVRNHENTSFLGNRA